MDVLITYDLVEGKQTEVKDAMKELGYQETIDGVHADGRPGTATLPNTTLWKNNSTVAQARKDLQEVVVKCKTKLERLFATECGNWSATVGLPYTD